MAANRAMMEGGVPRRTGEYVDALAASLILQGYLDSLGMKKPRWKRTRKSRMDKISFTLDETEKGSVLCAEETRLNGTDYILVTDSRMETEKRLFEGFIVRGDSEALYEIVDDDRELQGVMEIFEQLLEDTDITLNNAAVFWRQDDGQVVSLKIDREISKDC